jgi:hypothetical protein
LIFLFEGLSSDVGSLSQYWKYLKGCVEGTETLHPENKELRYHVLTPLTLPKSEVLVPLPDTLQLKPVAQHSESVSSVDQSRVRMESQMSKRPQVRALPTMTSGADITCILVYDPNGTRRRFERHEFFSCFDFHP